MTKPLDEQIKDRLLRQYVETGGWIGQYRGENVDLEFIGKNQVLATDCETGRLIRRFAVQIAIVPIDLDQ